MLNLKKYLITIVVILSLIMIFSACNDAEQLDLSKLNIEAIDQVDVPVGTYTVGYTIADLNKYAEQYGVVVTVGVVDNNSNAIVVSGDTFTVEANKVYTVTINATSSSGAVISKTITITAVQEEIYTEWTGEPLVNSQYILDDSIINDYEIQQIVMFRAVYCDSELANPDEIGIVYAKSDNPKIQGSGVTKVAGVINGLVNFQATSQVLQGSTTYYFRLYAIKDSIIGYTDTITYVTAEVVPMGGQVGCDYLVSGGVYNVDNGDETREHYVFANILNDFTAENENIAYSANALITKSGYNSLITTETSSGKRYLHVFKLNFYNPAIKLSIDNWDTKEYNGHTGLVATYNILDSYNYDFDYDISEAGVLFSYEHMFLEIGNADVTKKTAETIDLQNGKFSNLVPFEFAWIQANLAFEHKDIYARGYIIADGRVSYSDNITLLTYNSEQKEYEETKTFLTSTSILAENTYYTTAKTDVVHFAQDMKIETYTDNFSLNTAGTYYLMSYEGTEYTNDMRIITINRTPAVVTGVADDGKYNGSVIVHCEEINVVMHIVKDNEESKEFANGVKITETGHYVLSVIGTGPNLVIEFDIE